MMRTGDGHAASKGRCGFLPAIVVGVAVVALSLFWCFQKQGMFLDEIYSYGLSNSDYAPFVRTLREDGLTGNVLTHDELLGYVAVDDGQQFDYASVYYNQTQDVHPPLYYFVLHTICSLFPNVFSKWFGLGVNLVFLVVTLCLLYSLSRMLLGDRRLAAFVCLLYGASTGAISMVIMVRMYMMLTLLSVLLGWLITNHMERPRRWHYPAIAATVFAGMMTQYLYAVLAFFMCAGYGFYLLFHKRWGQAAAFGVSAVIGVVGMLAAFPAWYEQMHSQDVVNASTVTDNLVGGFAFYVRRLVVGIANVGLSIPVVGITAIAIAIAWLVARARGERGCLKAFPAGVVILGCSSILACAVIAIIAPYTDKRYLSNMVPFLVLLVVAVGARLCRTAPTRVQRGIALTLGGGAVVAGLLVTPSYVYPTYRHMDDVLSAHPDAACVYVTPERNPSFTSNVPQLLYMQDVCAVTDVDSEVLDGYLAQRGGDTAIVFVAEYPYFQDDGAICAELESRYGYSQVQEVYQENTFSHLYVLTNV